MNEGPIPWRIMMGIAFSQWSLSPDDFWSMTLIEFSAAVGNAQANTRHHTIDQESFSTMLAKYPDQ